MRYKTLVFRTSLGLVLISLSLSVLSGCFRNSACSGYPGYSTPASSGGGAAAVLTGAAGSPPNEARNSSQPAFTRPPLLQSEGQYFSWLMPAGWRANETANGVDLTSANGRLIANSALLTGNPGYATPWEFLVGVLTRLGARAIYGISRQDLPSQPSGYPEIYWQIQEFELTFIDAAGTAREADCMCGICNAYGGHSAIIQSYSVPVEEYDQAKTWMPLLPQSVLVTSPGQIAYQNQLIPVRNHPLDNSGLMESWRLRRVSQDRIAKAQHEAMMGYERMVSPSTGRHYNMPLEMYDGTVGGYRNPDHPQEILKPTNPGE